jgi:hypothetical protein
MAFTEDVFLHSDIRRHIKESISYFVDEGIQVMEQQVPGEDHSEACLEDDQCLYIS